MAICWWYLIVSWLPALSIDRRVCMSLLEWSSPIASVVYLLFNWNVNNKHTRDIIVAEIEVYQSLDVAECIVFDVNDLVRLEADRDPLAGHRWYLRHVRNCIVEKRYQHMPIWNSWNFHYNIYFPYKKLHIFSIMLITVIVLLILHQYS